MPPIWIGAPLGILMTPRSSVTGPTVTAEAACAIPNNAAAAPIIAKRRLNTLELAYPKSPIGSF